LPGIKPITNLKHLSGLPRDFHITIPSELVDKMEGSKTPAEARKAGIKFTLDLCQKLIDFGVPGIHIYTMGKGTAAYELLGGLF
jgi:methylenetetrahydrofolate reductase (NADPH)